MMEVDEQFLDILDDRTAYDKFSPAFMKSFLCFEPEQQEFNDF